MNRTEVRMLRHVDSHWVFTPFLGLLAVGASLLVWPVASEPDVEHVVPEPESCVDQRGIPEDVRDVEYASELRFDPPDPYRHPYGVVRRPRNVEVPPPGGSFQDRAVHAARARDCVGAFTAVEQGMAVNLDHAMLFWGVWLCFQEAHQRRVLEIEVTDSRSLAAVLEHLEGARVGQRTAADGPAWVRSATGGLEFRLQAYQDSPWLSDYLSQRYEYYQVADALLVDLHVEAQLASWLSLQPATPLHTEALARRVFVIRRALNGHIGDLLRAHRPDDVATVVSLLGEAVRISDAPQVRAAATARTESPDPTDVR